MRISVPIVALLLVGCESAVRIERKSDLAANVGRDVTVQGVAFSGKGGTSLRPPGLMIDISTFHDGPAWFPRDVIGQTVEVTGRLNSTSMPAGDFDDDRGFSPIGLSQEPLNLSKTPWTRYYLTEARWHSVPTSRSAHRDE